jgi:AmmeMemoRadiSam system protein A/AmmeMemoRadiSam system protein B
MRSRWSRGWILAAVVIGTGSLGQACAQETGAVVRPLSRPGFWFPDDAETLTKMVDEAVARVSPKLKDKPVALISPHAGYRLTAPVMAEAFACLKGHTYKRVIVIGFSHSHSSRFRGVDVPSDLTAYRTPIGNVPIDREACDTLLAHPLFSSHAGLDRSEHSVENQLPFLQRVLGEFAFVPLLVGRMSDADYAEAAEAILPLVDENTLLVASTDFTHYGASYNYQPFRTDVSDGLRNLADRAAAPLLRCDYDGFVKHLIETKDTICGRDAIRLQLRILSMQGGAEGVRTAFDTSGRLLNDWSSSVTYQSFAFSRKPGKLSEQEQGALLRIARETATAYLKGEKQPGVDVDKLLAALKADGACFVTLKNHGELRGCIGNMTAIGPLYEGVISNAIAACKDYRFAANPVTAEEMQDIDVEISYLTPLERVSKTDDIVVGRHGLLITLGRNRGVLLPQVAYERGWTREEFLQHTCLKAGLPTDAWKRPETEIYCFEAEVFGEKG